MPSKDTATITIKTTQDVKDRFLKRAEEQGVTLSKYGLDALENYCEPKHDYLKELADKLQIEPNVLVWEIKNLIDNEDLVYDNGLKIKSSGNPYQRKFDRFVEKLIDKGYPDSSIGQMVDQIIEKASELGRFNPKRARMEYA